ncbi:hypothetical protein A2U01_0002670 [Trifolium medium]|uniref:Uncharacterized protein n=1 Tax=Trifolium medium TaxID=97028 RepID=A0A392M3F2_9FABA|nr:hypothetical protein [Trifolium medium]
MQEPTLCSIDFLTKIRHLNNSGRESNTYWSVEAIGAAYGEGVKLKDYLLDIVDLCQ